MAIVILKHSRGLSEIGIVNSRIRTGTVGAMGTQDAEWAD